MNIHVERENHKTATVRWSPVLGAQHYTIDTKDDSVGTCKRDTVHTRSFKADLIAGHSYKFTIRAYKTGVVGRLLKDSVQVQAVFTKNELDELHTKAVNFVSGHGCDVISWLYRNKSPSYFEEILNDKDGIMECYTKDNNGDPASIINGQIDGLFFAAHLDTCGKIPDTSIFGDERILISAKAVLVDRPVRLYFADFYCIHRWHYVKIVLTSPGTHTDQFCERNLIELDRNQNEFLSVGPRRVIRAASQAHIEVFYTNDLNIVEWEESGVARRESVPSFGRMSRPSGLPKKRGCTVCNLDITKPLSGYNFLEYSMRLMQLKD